MSHELYFPKSYNTTGTEGSTSEKLWARRKLNQTGGSSGHELYVPRGIGPDPLVITVKGFYDAPPRGAESIVDRLAPENYALNAYMSEIPPDLVWDAVDENWDNISVTNGEASLSVSENHYTLAQDTIPASDLMNWGRYIKVTRIQAAGDWHSDSGSYLPTLPLAFTIWGDSRETPTDDPAYDPGTGNTVKLYGISSIDKDLSTYPLYGIKYITNSNTGIGEGVWDSFDVTYSSVNLDVDDIVVVSSAPTEWDYFEGKENMLATWIVNSDGKNELIYQTPDDGMLIYSEADAEYFQYDASLPGWLPVTISWPSSYNPYLTAYWRFENNTNDSLPPGSTYNNYWSDGGYTPISYTTGKRGQCAVLSSSGYYAAPQDDINPLTSVAISAWIKPTAYVSTLQTDYIMASDSLGYALGLENIGTIGTHALPSFSTIINGTTVKACTWQLTDGLTLNVWHHLVGIVDRTTHNVYLYVNGIEKSALSVPSVGNISTALGLVYLGHHISYSNSNYNGHLDELCFYKNIAFSSSSARRGFVADLYNSGSGNFYI